VCYDITEGRCLSELPVIRVTDRSDIRIGFVAPQSVPRKPRSCRRNGALIFASLITFTGHKSGSNGGAITAGDSALAVETAAQNALGCWSTTKSAA